LRLMTRYPFSALVGQALLKKGLLVNAVDPTIGGVLLRGEKGTGKTTAVRSFASVLPSKEVARGCRFGCVRGGVLCDECLEREASGEVRSYEERAVEVVDLPLNASEDRVVGSLDLEAALREGSRKFEMGVLGKANGNVLYIDEVNLLEDHVVDVLLDVAVSGENVVMREGVSYRHPSRFLLVGTMNPEEGELRPQLLDRFGVCVEITGEREIPLRKSIVERVLRFEQGDPAFRETWEREDRALRERVATARGALAGTTVSDAVLESVVAVVAELGVAGHRGDIMVLKAARALAALKGLPSPDEECLSDAFRLALPHRLKEDPFEESTGAHRRLEGVLARFGSASSG
jgi:magnesium chelatase subunit I